MYFLLELVVKLTAVHRRLLNRKRKESQLGISKTIKLFKKLLSKFVVELADILQYSNEASNNLEYHSCNHRGAITTPTIIYNNYS